MKDPPVTRARARARSWTWLAFQRSIFGHWRIWSGNSFSGWWSSRHEQYAAANLLRSDDDRRREARTGHSQNRASRWRQGRRTALPSDAQERHIRVLEYYTGVVMRENHGTFVFSTAPRLLGIALLSDSKCHKVLKHPSIICLIERLTVTETLYLVFMFSFFKIIQLSSFYPAKINAKNRASFSPTPVPIGLETGCVCRQVLRSDYCTFLQRWD